MYPAIVYGSTLGADGAGNYLISSPKSSSNPPFRDRYRIWNSQRPTSQQTRFSEPQSRLGQASHCTRIKVWSIPFLEPNIDYDRQSFGILGGGANPPIGTFSEYILVERDQVIPTPDHLTDVQAAAWPLGGVAAWRSRSFSSHTQRVPTKLGQ